MTQTLIRGIDKYLIDLERFDPELADVKSEASRIRKEGVFTFIFIGGLVREKGINELVEAFKRLNAQYPDTRLFLVGKYEQAIDPLKPETIAEIDSDPAIEAVGSQADVRPWLLASDALVFPSYREGFPNVVIEAGAMGLPSIVTDINGSRDIIMDGENGIIIPPRQSDSLQLAMEIFITDKSMVNRLSAKARPMIASRFEQSFVRRCLKEYYKEIRT